MSFGEELQKLENLVEAYLLIVGMCKSSTRADLWLEYDPRRARRLITQ